MSRINILYIITKPELGGAQLQLLTLLRGLEKERYNIFLFTAEEGPLLNDFRAINGVRVRTSRFLAPPVNPFKDLCALFEIRRFIGENNITIVHTHSSKAGIVGRLAARWAGVENIFHTVHGWSFNDYQPWPVRRMYIFLERFAACFPGGLIVVSDFDRRKGIAERIGKESGYRLIRYGIDFFSFRVPYPGVREEFGWDDSVLVIGNISCFKPQKAPLDFIKFAFLLKQKTGNRKIKFLLVGDGILRRRIEKLVSVLGLEDDVVLSGWRRDIPRILAGMDIVVLTSLWEGLPISVLEAMVSSLPVVATDTGGISEVVVEGITGYLVKPRDMPDMCGKVSLLLNEEQMRKKIGSQARKSLGSIYTVEYMIHQYQELYRRGQVSD
ncbi:MAG: glycosyltransferase family 4 protein [Candidatus Omnitrophica bacterium]|nr:glycosyltransferase family 4 protein [Candidatus Omnitrophota bacterium]